MNEINKDNQPMNKTEAIEVLEKACELIVEGTDPNGAVLNIHHAMALIEANQ